MPSQRLDSAISQEHFYAFLEGEMKKIEKFTKDQVFHPNIMIYNYVFIHLHIYLYYFLKHTIL